MSRLMPAPSDARTFTSYVSSSQMEEQLQRRSGAINENQYRDFLQKNAPEVAQQLSAVNVVTAPEGGYPWVTPRGEMSGTILS